MTTYLYIINEHMAKETQGPRYVVKKAKARPWSEDSPWRGLTRLAYISDSVLKLEEGKPPEWVKNRWPHKPLPTEKEIAIMLLKADAQ